MDRARIRATICCGVLLAGLLVMGPSAHAEALHTRYFQMPSGNIGCYFGDTYLRCDILSGLNPEPDRSCELDWTGLTLATDGRARPTCAGDTVVDRGSRVLQYGHRWKRGGVVCRSRQSGLRCHNRMDHGFVLSRDDWRRF